MSLAVRRVPAKLRSIELQRQSNYNSGSEASLLSAVMDQVWLCHHQNCCPSPLLAMAPRLLFINKAFAQLGSCVPPKDMLILLQLNAN